MKRAQLAILILLVVVLGAGAFLLVKRRTTSWASSTDYLPEKVVSLPINDVAQITIQQPEFQVNLRKKGDVWVVAERADYPANFEMVSTVIRKVWELKPIQEVKVGPSQLGRLALLQPGQGADSGTLVDFKNAEGKRLAALLFGKKYMRESNQSFAPGRSFPVGRYVMAEDGSHHVDLVAEPFQQIDGKPETWLDRGFIKIEKPTTIAVSGPNPPMNWKLEREQGAKEWKLADAQPREQLDTAKANQLASALNSISSFTDVLAPESKPESVGLNKPTTITVTTEDGFNYLLRIGNAVEQSYALTVSVSANLVSARTPPKDEKPEDKTKLDKEFQTRHETLEKKLASEKKLEGRTFLVPKYGIDQLKKNRADLLAAPTPRPSPSPSPVARPKAK
jgi:Domain of unknown function (DUF4340)